MFHIDATVLTVIPAMLLATTAAIGDRFSASGFWDDVRRVRATVFDFMGATLTMLHKLPPACRRRSTILPGWGGECRCRSSPTSSSAASACNWSSCTARPTPGCPMYHPLDEPRRPGSCGRADPAVRRAPVRRATDVEVAAGDDGRDRRSTERAVVHVERLLRHARGDAGVAAQPVVPHRRSRPPRRRRLLLLRRPARATASAAGARTSRRSRSRRS